MSSALSALSTAWRQLRPRPDLHAGSRQLVATLQAGASLKEALERCAGTLAKCAVHEADLRFEGGALALFIVDVRDGLRRQLFEAARQVQDALVAQALVSAAAAVDEDAFVGHLINALLRATDLYTEAHSVERVQTARCTREVTALLERSLCVLLSRTDAARTCGERPRRLTFIPLPQPSRP